MADQELDLKMQEALIKSSQNLQVSMERYNGLLEKVVGKFQDINKQETQINVELEKTSKTLKEKILGRLKDIGTELKDHIMRPFLAIFSVGKILEVGKAMLEHTKRIKDLSFRMGEAGKTIGQLTSAMYGTARALGVSTDEALDLIEGLRNLRVSTKDMQMMATVTGQFARITGVSNQEAASLTGNLMRFGRLGTTATKDVLNVMANMQRTIGLSATDMSDLSDTIITSTRALHNFGIDASQITKFNKDTVQLAGAFTKVGLSAKDASGWVEKLLDPGAIEDNALALSKMGISIQDVISGTADVSDMQKGMKKLGEEIKGMSGPAGAALAKMMGTTRNMAISWSEMPDAVKGTNEATGKMFQDQRSAQDRFAGAMNNINTTMESWMSKLNPVIEKIASFLEPRAILVVAAILAGVLIAGLIKFRRTMMSVATDFGKTVGTATSESLVMAGQKAAAVSAGRAGMAGRGATSGYRARVEAGPGYTAAKNTQQIFQALAQSDVFPRVAKMTENIAEWYHYVALGQKPLSLLGVLTEQNNQKLRDRIGFIKQEALMLGTTYETQKDIVDKQLAENQGRIKDLRLIEKRTGEQEWELQFLLKKVNHLLPQEAKLRDAIHKIDTQEENRLKRVVSRMLPDARSQYALELKTKQQTLETDLARDKALQKDLQLQSEILMREQKMLEVQKAIVPKTQDEINNYHKVLARLKEIGAENNVINQSMAETTEKLKNEETVAKRLAREMEIVGNVGAPSGAKATSGLRRIGDFIKSSFHSAVQGADNILTRSKNSIAVILKDVGARLNPANLFRAGRGQAVEQGQNKLVGALGKTIGPLLKVAGIVAMVLTTLGVMEPIQKVIGALLKGFAPIFQELMKRLLPVFLKILSALLPLVAILINTLLPPLLVVLGYAVKLISILIQAIAKLVGVFGGKQIEDMLNTIAKSVDDAGNTLIKTGEIYLKDKLISDTAVKQMQESLKHIDMNTNPETGAGAGAGGTAGVATTQSGSVRVLSKPRFGTSAPAENAQTTADNTSNIAATSQNQTQILQDISTNIRYLVGYMTGRTAPSGGAH